MEEKRLRVQRISAICAILLFFATLLSFFIIPHISDARTRRALGDEKAYVTGSARSPWISVDTAGRITLYPENLIGVTELVIPDAVDGVRVTGIATGVSNLCLDNLKTIVFPASFSAVTGNMLYFHACENLETFIFSEGITDLSHLDIYEMPSLRSVYLPASLEVGLYTYAVRNCGENVTVYYAGSEEDWASLGSWAERLAKRCVIVYNTSVPEY